MGILNDLITRANNILTAVQNIKTAANSKGAGITGTDPLSRFAQRINSIPDPEPVVYTIDSNNVINSLQFKEELTIPEEVDGTPVSVTFSLPAVIRSAIIYTIKKLIVPEYFDNYNFDTSPESWNANTTLHYIDFLGHGTFSASNLQYLLLHELNLPNATGSPAASVNSGATYSGTLQLKINAPHISTWSGSIGGSNCICDVTQCNFEDCTVFGGTAYSVSLGAYIVGVLNLPSVTTMRSIALVQNEAGLTIKTPLLKHMEYTLFRSAAGTGVLHWYIGRDLMNVRSSEILAHANRVDIHIPAGASTTKNTLDAAGITYTQDYNI